MASVVGKWKIESCDNFEDFMVTIGVSDEKRSDAHKYLSTGSDMTQEFSSSGDDWTLKTHTVMGDRETKFTLGKSFESMTLDGRPVTITFSVDGDNLVEEQTGEGFKCTHVRQGSGNTLTMTLKESSKGVTCVRKFSKVN